MHYVLIVDKDADVRHLLRITLGKLYDVVEADNGFDALCAVRKYHPCAVLLEVMLPGGIDGLQVLDAVKSNCLTRDVLVVMVTACSHQAERAEAKRRGADAYFIKPFSPLQLVTWLWEQVPG